MFSYGQTRRAIFTDASRASLSEDLLNFVGINKLLPGHHREGAFARLTDEQHVRRVQGRRSLLNVVRLDILFEQ